MKKLKVLIIRDGFCVESDTRFSSCRSYSLEFVEATSLNYKPILAEGVDFILVDFFTKDKIELELCSVDVEIMELGDDKFMSEVYNFLKMIGIGGSPGRTYPVTVDYILPFKVLEVAYKIAKMTL